MAKYPVRLLKDKNRQPFFPFNTLSSVLVDGTDKTLLDIINDMYTQEEIDLLIATMLSKFVIVNRASQLPTTGVREGNVAIVLEYASDPFQSSMVYYRNGRWEQLTQRGMGLQFRWDGTRLGVKREDETTYQYVDLEGPTYTITTADYRAIADIVKRDYVDGNGVKY